MPDTMARNPWISRRTTASTLPSCETWAASSSHTPRCAVVSVTTDRSPARDATSARLAS
uniref:Uncharacterized protein n=1 Tax=Human herpesvirus 2 TaxID=10310 RepID=A0A481TU15_HHV2|nr:hypothetical protein [Human alphaherpesvirus 2]QBH84726.1 hypothetical protein [Human alphaherpesvirus 2]